MNQQQQQTRSAPTREQAARGQDVKQCQREARIAAALADAGYVVSSDNRWPRIIRPAGAAPAIT